MRDGSSDEKSEDTVQSSDLEFLDDGTQAPVQSVGFYRRSLLSQPASVHALSCCHKLMRLCCGCSNGHNARRSQRANQHRSRKIAAQKIMIVS